MTEVELCDAVTARVKQYQDGAITLYELCGALDFLALNNIEVADPLGQRLITESTGA